MTRLCSRLGLQVQNLRCNDTFDSTWRLSLYGCKSTSSAFTPLQLLSTHSLDAQFQDEVQSQPNHHCDRYSYHDFHCQDFLWKYGGCELEAIPYLHVWCVGSKEALRFRRPNWGSIGGRRSRQGRCQVRRLRGHHASDLDEFECCVGENMIW